jgi:hypothetical protein
LIEAYLSIRDLFSEELTEWGNVVVSIGDPKLIPELLRTFDLGLMILDPYIRGAMHCEFLERIKNQKPHLLMEGSISELKWEQKWSKY